MAYEKLKKEEYRNIGGINQKASVYVTGETEVLDLVNYDFSTPGAWTKRWGMTGALAGNTLAVGASNRYNFGFQTYLVSNPIGSTLTFTQVCYIQGNSQTYSLSLSNGVLAQSSTLTVTPGYGNATSVVAGSSFLQDRNTYQKASYFVSGKTAFKATTDGIYYYGLPQYADGAAAAPTSNSLNTGSLTGTYILRACYMDNLNYIGPAGQTFTISTSGTSLLVFSGFTFTNHAIASGATGIVVFSNRVWQYPTDEMVAVGFLPYSGIGSVTLTIQGITSGLLTPYGYGAGGNLNQALLPSTVSNLPAAFDFTTFNTGDADAVELYASRLFWAVSKGKNILFYSEIIEFYDDPQIVNPENFIQLSNSEYPVIAIKAFNQSLIAFHQKGVARIVGDSPSNFSGFELSDEYGLVSSRALAFFKERIWFLDSNHIIEYNGANLNIVSHRVDSIIARMNVTAAQKTAMAYHYEERHEVWFAIPIDGATENNIILVYDYLADGWTTFKSSSNFTCLQPFYDQTVVQGLTASSVVLDNKHVHTGHPGGSLGYFGASFASDYGNTITLSIKTRYHVEQGPSTTMLWRRLYLDTGPFAGVTLPFKVNFYANFATVTPALSTTMIESGSPYSGEQQTRIDFGIPAKSLSAEIIYGFTAAVRVYGYTVESRFLRRV